MDVIIVIVTVVVVVWYVNMCHGTRVCMHINNCVIMDIVNINEIHTTLLTYVYV